MSRNATDERPAEGPVKKPGALRYKLLTLCVSTIVFLLIGEAIFRLAGIRGIYLETRIDTVIGKNGASTQRAPHGFVPFATKRTKYDTDPRDYFDPGGTIDHSFNSVGWRSEEHSLEKPPGTYRILALGDSYTFGQGVRREHLCVERLEALLNGKSFKERVETINAGISAYNTINERDLLAQKGVHYDPDLVIVHFVPNDIEDKARGDGPRIVFNRNYSNTYIKSDTLSDYSYLWSWARQRILKYFRGQAYIDECLDLFHQNSEKWLSCRAALKDIRRICLSREIKLFVAIYPFFYNLDGDYPFQPIHDLVTEFCTQSEVPVLDLKPFYEEYNGPELWVHPTDQHPNNEAHEIAARAIADFLFDHAGEFGLE